jgi:hypothetical protein
MLFAKRAMRRRINQGNSAGHTVHNHIVKATDTGAQHKKNSKTVPKWDFFHKTDSIGALNHTRFSDKKDRFKLKKLC